MEVVPAGEADVLFRCVCACKMVWVYTEGQRPSHVVPPCAVRASCAGRAPKPPSAGVSELSPVYVEWDRDRSLCSCRASLTGVTTEDVERFNFKMLWVLFLHFLKKVIIFTCEFSTIYISDNYILISDTVLTLVS